MTPSPASKPPLLRQIAEGVLVGAVLALLAVSLVSPRVLWLAYYWRDPAQYLVPVEGVEARHIASTFGAPRPGGRKHRGADIFAPRVTPVVSATDGVVMRVGDNTLGGHVVWVVGEGHSIYYYAHLDHWADGLHHGQRVHAGEVLGFVGNTGNAVTTPPHLHFAIHRLGLGLMGIDPVPVLADARTIPVVTSSVLRARASGR